jgi:hypothetical protein
MTVLITLTTAGTDSGPFDLYSDLDGYISAFESGVSKASLLAGYPSSLVPDFTTIIRVRSNNGLCTNYIEIPVQESTTTTTSTTSSVTVPLGSSIGFPGPDTCTSLTITSSFTNGGGTLIERGICYNTTGNPSIDDFIFIGPTVTGVSTVDVTGLTPSTTYYWRAYAINEVGVGYYQTVLADPTGFIFSTDACPTTTTTTTVP